MTGDGHLIQSGTGSISYFASGHCGLRTVLLSLSSSSHTRVALFIPDCLLPGAPVYKFPLRLTPTCLASHRRLTTPRSPRALSLTASSPLTGSREPPSTGASFSLVLRYSYFSKVANAAVYLQLTDARFPRPAPFLTNFSNTTTAQTN